MASFLANLVLAAGTLAPPPPVYRLEAAPVQQVQAVMTLEAQAPKVVAKEWLLYAPRLPELPGQARVDSTLEPSGKGATEESALKRGILFSRVRVKDKEMEKSLALKVRYRAELRSRNLVPVRRGDNVRPVPPLGEKEREAALGTSYQVDFKSKEFQSWLDAQSLRRGKAESDLDFARRAFRAIRKKFSYDYHTGMDRRSSAVCKAGKSDCGGLAALLVSTLRANDVPARLLAGRWAESMDKGKKINGIPYYQTHVKAEFFAEGIGWVPADVTSAVTQSKSTAELAHFGHDEGNFLVFHVDADLKIDRVYFGMTDLDWFLEPVFWISGTGSVEGLQTTQDWQVQSDRLKPPFPGNR